MEKSIIRQKDILGKKKRQTEKVRQTGSERNPDRCSTDQMFTDQGKGSQKRGMNMVAGRPADLCEDYTEKDWVRVAETRVQRCENCRERRDILRNQLRDI
jgi:hypothetical protein